MADAVDITPSRKPRRRRRRWLLRVPIIVVSLLLTTAVIAQVFLWTDYPRQIAETQITNILHVKAKICAIHIGWTGRTVVDGLELTLPMESEPFIRVDTIHVRHTSLPLIAFTQDVDDVAVSGVDVALRQTANGRWNLQALASPSDDASAAASPTASKQNPFAGLPDLHVADAKVNVTLADGRSVRLDSLSAELTKSNAVTAVLAAKVGGTIAVTGQLGLVPAMPHDVSVHVASLPADVRKLLALADPTAPINADLVWTGHRTNDGIDGSLRIDRATAGEVHASGRLDVSAASDVSIRPADVKVDIAGGATLDAAIHSGRLVFDRGKIRVEQLRGVANGGGFAAEGSIDPASLASTLTAEWEQIHRADVATSGTLKVETSRELSGRLVAAIDLRGNATTPGGSAEGAVTIRGAGDALNAFSADVRVEPLTWRPTKGSPVVSPPLTGRIVTEGSVVRLASLSLTDASHGSLDVYGAFDRANQTWWATIDAGKLELPAIAAQGVKGPIDLSIAATGTLIRADVSKLYAHLDRGTLWSSGAYVWTDPQPLSLATWVWYDKPVTEDEAAQLNSLRANGMVVGTVSPPNLSAEVDVTGSELVVESRRVGDVSIHVTATINDDIARVRSRDLEMLGGKWTVKGDWSRTSGQPPTVVATFRDLPAANLGELLGQPALTGTIDRGEATIHLPSTRLDRIDMTATATGTDLAMGPFHAKSMELDATLKDGKFVATPVLHDSGGTVAARLTGPITLDEPIGASVTLDNWATPDLSRASADGTTVRFLPRLSGSVNAQLDSAAGDVSADVALSGTLDRDDAHLADFKIDASLARKILAVKQIRIDTLDGNITAGGSLDLRAPNATKLDVELTGLTPSRLAWLNPIAQEVQGKIGGTLSIHPSTADRPLGPLQIELALRPEGSSYHGIDIGAIDLNAFANIDLAGKFRLVTDHASIEVAGGRIEPFARISHETGIPGFSQLITADFTNLDLKELVHAVDNDGKDLIGRLGGRVQLYGSTTSLKRLSGDATVNITESDLANFGPIAALYNVLSVGTAGNKPDGSGSVSLRVGEGVLTIDDANYFNRGVYANGFGTVHDIDLMTDAPLELTVFGSLQPLRAVKLPFFGDLNDTFAALQSSVTAIRATGTLKDPKAQQVTLGSLGETIQKALLGKVRER